MSEGLMCLRCRRYIAPASEPCTCADPLPSLDGKTPVGGAAPADERDAALTMVHNHLKYGDALDVALFERALRGGAAVAPNGRHSDHARAERDALRAALIEAATASDEWVAHVLSIVTRALGAAPAGE